MSPRRTLCKPYALWEETSRPSVDQAPSEQIHSANPTSRDVGSAEDGLKYHRIDMFVTHVERSCTCGHDLRIQ